jgi:hypothetical protein
MKEEKRKERFISIAEAAERLSINHTSIRKRKCGTDRLTHVRPGGGKRVLLIESEVDALVDHMIERARAQTPAAAVNRHLRRVI